MIRDSGPDLLSDVLVALRLRGRLFCRSELSAPWAIAFPAGSFAHFHLVQRGHCRLRVGGEEIALHAGDLVVLPHGHGHVLSDGSSRRPQPLSALLPRAQWGAHALIRHGGSGAAAHMLCGGFEFEGPVDHPLITQLPAIVKVARRHDPTGWLGSTLDFLQAEARRPSPGSELLQAHLLGVAFVQMIRSATRGRDGSWLTALRDRQIGEALRLMHTSPGRRWSVATLGRHVGLSRSTFAARFSALVGDSPLAYLDRWRLDVAAHLLRTGPTGLEEIADRVGYASAPSLVRAFRRRFGVTPGLYRTRSGQNPARTQSRRFGTEG